MWIMNVIMIMIAAILLGLGDRKREPQSQTRETFGLNEFSQPEKPNKIKIKFKFKCKYKYKASNLQQMQFKVATNDVKTLQRRIEKKYNTKKRAISLQYNLLSTHLT